MRTWLTVLAVIIVAASTASAEERLLELLKTDVHKHRTAFVTRALRLTEEQSDVFWPVYKKYQADLSRLLEERSELVKEYSAHHETMTDEKAKDLVGRAFRFQERRTRLLKKYYAKVARQISPRLAARWVQVEQAINTLTDIQAAAQLPLLQ